jgi:hypothetical protein
MTEGNEIDWDAAIARLKALLDRLYGNRDLH